MRVVHCKREPYTHYIGRPTIFGNPNHLWDASDDVARTKVIEEFEVYARHTPKVLNAIRDLPEDAVLGCWCKPKHACHGDVIMKLWKELHV